MIFVSVLLMLQREKGAEQEEATHAEARLHASLFCKANFAFAPCALYILDKYVYFKGQDLQRIDFDSAFRVRTK